MGAGGGKEFSIPPNNNNNNNNNNNGFLPPITSYESGVGLKNNDKKIKKERKKSPLPPRSPRDTTNPRTNPLIHENNQNQNNNHNNINQNLEQYYNKMNNHNEVYSSPLGHPSLPAAGPFSPDTPFPAVETQPPTPSNNNNTNNNENENNNKKMDFNDENEWFDVKKEYEQFQLETTSETNNNNNHHNHESTLNNSDAVVRVLHQTNDSYMHTNTVTVMEDSDLNCISPIPLQGDRRQPQDHSLSEDENNIHNHHTITVSYSEEEKPSDIPPNSDDEDTSSIIMTNINHNNDSATPADMVNLLTLNEENFTPSEIQNINIKNKSRTRSPPPSSPVHHTQDMHRYHTVMRSISPATTLTEEYSHIPLPQVYEALNSRHRIFKLCLTGGPCGGKSSLLTQLQHNFFDRSGYRVMCVPEAATLLVSGGMQWDASLVREQQLILIKTQLLLEDRFYELAALSGVPTLIVSDRGTMDGRAFCSDEDFHFILNELGCTLEVLRDRYDGVLHVVSAAVGAEAYYNNDNTARYEDVEGARLSDLKLRQAYVGHAQLRLLENKKGESFTDKIENGFQMIERMVKGEEIDTEDENNQNNNSRTSHVVLKKNITLEEMREALSSDTAEHTTAIASYKEYHTILMNSDMKEVRLVVKRVMPDGSALHLFKSISIQENNNNSNHKEQKVERSKRISSKEYESFLLHKDVSREVVETDCFYLLYHKVGLEVSTMVRPEWAKDKQILKIQSTSQNNNNENENNDLLLPPCLQVEREVPTDPCTTLFLISHRETGPLYTALAFAPVFRRNHHYQNNNENNNSFRRKSNTLRRALEKEGYADVEDIMNSTVMSNVSEGPHTPPPREEKENNHNHNNHNNETKNENTTTEEVIVIPAVKLTPIETNNNNNMNNNKKTEKKKKPLGEIQRNHNHNNNKTEKNHTNTANISYDKENVKV